MRRLGLPQNFAKLVLPVVMGVVLVACQSGGGEASRDPITQGRPYKDNYDVVQLSADSVGSFLSAATTGIHGDDGYELTLEERYYPTMNASRFVVSQIGLADRIASVGVTEINLSITKNGGTLESIDILNHPVVDLTEEPFVSGFFASELSALNGPNRVCALLSVEYADDKHYAHALNTCDPRGFVVTD